jgi:type IV pilus assembly protein PilC
MARFKYTAMDAKGVESEGVLDAESQSEAVTMIRAKGFFPTKVSVVGSGVAPKKGQEVRGAAQPAAGSVKKEIRWLRFLGGRVRTKQLMVFARQLATLVDAGLPLLRGLRILLQQEKNLALREAISGMGEAVEGGSTFSEALALYPKIFDKLFVNMVRAGEAGGVLEVVLTRLADFLEKAERIRRKVRTAMIYPVVVLVAAIGILTFMLWKIIPQFAAVFQDLLGGGAQLPALTLFVIAMSDFVRYHGYLILIAFGALWVALKIWRKTDHGRFTLDKIKLKAPILGPLFLKTAVARFSRTLGTLMSAGVPVLQALNIVRDTSGNFVVERAVQGIHDSVKEGDTMTMPMEASGVFPAMVVSMVDVGEETGALPEMLSRIADNYEEEVDAAVEGLTSIIEPIMIIMLAVIVGTIVIAMFVPLIKLVVDMAG